MGPVARLCVVLHLQQDFNKNCRSFKFQVPDSLPRLKTAGEGLR